MMKGCAGNASANRAVHIGLCQLPFAFSSAAPTAQKSVDDASNFVLHFLNRAVGVQHLNSLRVAPSNREVPIPDPLLKLQSGHLKASLLGLDPILASGGTLEGDARSHVKKQSEIWLGGATNNPVETAYGRSAQPAAVTLIREAGVIEAVAEDYIPLRQGRSNHFAQVLGSCRVHQRQLGQRRQLC